MKNLILIFVIATSASIFGQSNRAAKMAPILVDGYYVNRRGDTVRGKIQTNVIDELDFYTGFFFQKPNTKKVKRIDAKLAKAYGYSTKEFVLFNYNNKNLFLERLVNGRLRFYEYKYKGKIDGIAAIESDFFIRDSEAEGNDLSLQELKRLSGMFYKKSLKPYMKDQPHIWKELDKYSFELQNVIAAVKEFNNFYSKK